MEFTEGGIRVEVGEKVWMQPFRDHLHGHELIGAVVELVPDRVHAVATRHRSECGRPGDP